MSERENKELVSRFYRDVVRGGDIDLMDKLVAEDVVEHEPIPGQETTPENRDEVKEMVRTFTEAFPDLDPHVEQIVAEGDRVAAFVRLTGTHEGSFFGIEPSNEQIETNRVDVFRVEDGLIREHWGVADNLTMLSQMGEVEPPRSG